MRIRSNQRGYLLIEVIVATLIITVAVFAAAGLFSQSLTAINDTRQYTVATSLAQKQLEILKSWKTDQWNTLSVPAQIPWQDGDDPYPFTVSTQIVLCPEDPANFWQATVTVTWNANSSLNMSAYYPKLNW